MHGCSALQALPFAVLIFVFANGAGLISRLFARRTAVMLGEISYGVYILHFPLLDFYRWNVNAFGLWPGWQTYVVFWALLLLLSHWLWVGIERPARRAIVGLLPVKQSLPVQRPQRGIRWASLGTMVRRIRAFLAARRFVVVESAIVILAMVALGIHAARASFHMISRNQAAADENACLRDIRFGDGYVLRSATVVRAECGRQLQLIWESLTPHNDWFHAVVQFKDKSGKVIDSVDGASKFPRGGVSPGQVWKQRIYLPKDLCDDSDQIVMVLLKPKKLGEYPIRDGPVDESGRLIVVAQGVKLE
jgi:hypothetical protein